MEFNACFPIWDQLNSNAQEALLRFAVRRNAPAGTLLHSGSDNCEGLFLVDQGRLRAYILSDEGKEVTLYRLFERDICLFSASCILQSIRFEINIEAEKDTSLWVVPSKVYKQLMENDLSIANYTNQIMAHRFSEVMWLIEQVMWKSFDRRLSGFLLEESALVGDDCLKITHDKIAAHLGSAREVVTRMLRYFQQENMVQLARGEVRLTNKDRLRDLAEK